MKKTVLTFGLISGAIMALMIGVTIPFHDVLGFDLAEVIGYTSIIAASLLIFFGVRSYRDRVAGGTVSFGRALAVGVLIAVVASLLYVATWQIIYYSSNTGSDFVARYQAHEIEKARAGGASQADIDKKTAELQRFAELYKNPAINAAITLIEPLPIGLVMALVSAGILSRKRRDPAATPNGLQVS